MSTLMHMHKVHVHVSHHVPVWSVLVFWWEPLQQPVRK